jgi:hypothetical protein
MRFLFLTCVFLPLTALSAGWSDSSTYTLYRDTLVENVTPRIHVATFDAGDNEQYNRENCEQARKLFQAQPSVQTKFWCEKGRFKK